MIQRLELLLDVARGLGVERPKVDALCSMISPPFDASPEASIGWFDGRA